MSSYQSMMQDLLEEYGQDQECKGQTEIGCDPNHFLYIFQLPCGVPVVERPVSQLHHLAALRMAPEVARLAHMLKPKWIKLMWENEAVIALQYCFS